MLLAVVRTNSLTECYHAVRGLFPKPGYGHGLRHIVALVLRVATVGPPLVHGALLVFLYLDSDEADYAGVAGEEVGVWPAVRHTFFWGYLLAL